MKHKDVVGTLDISGYKLTYEVTGGNSDTGSLEVTATNKGATASNNDISINNLNYPNANYTITTHLFNVISIYNATVSRTAYTVQVILLQVMSHKIQEQLPQLL